MAALDFPAAPNVNDTYSANGRTWTWTGQSWIGASPGGGTADPVGYARREVGYHTLPATGTNIAVGMTAPSGAGSTAAADDADGAFLSYTTDGSSGNTAGWTTSLAGVVYRQFQPHLVWRTKTGASIADVGLWAGAFSASPDNNADPTAHLAAFRYYTSTDGTAFWRCCTKDGTTINVTTTTAAIAAATLYVLRILCGASDVKFYVNDVLVATHTANLPTSTQAMGYAWRITALAAAAKTWKVSHFWASHL